MIDTTSFMLGNLQSISNYNQYQSIIDWRLPSMKLVVSMLYQIPSESSLYIAPCCQALLSWCIHLYIYILYLFSRNMIFWILSMYLFLQMPFKRKFCISNFVKSTKICKIREKIHTRKLVHFRNTFPEFQSDVIIKN